MQDITSMDIYSSTVGIRSLLLQDYFSKKVKPSNDVVEPDYYIYSLERYGIICYKKLGDPAQCFAFAWQIAENTQLFMRFDIHDRSFIESLAAEERHDFWYYMAGQQLMDLGFKLFTN